MNTTFGQQLKQKRRLANVSQRDLATKVGVDYTYISKVENDHLPPPSAETIEKIAQVLGVESTLLLSHAKKLPTEIKESLSGSPEAMKFISEVSAMNLSKDEWRRLTENLKHLR